MSFIFAAAIGVIAAIFLPHGNYLNEFGDLDISAVGWTILWFAVGMFVGSIVRFVGPKREHVITLLGTMVIQVLKTGIRLTLPWPLGWTHQVVSTEVRAHKVKVQIKSKDNLVFQLPSTIQHRVQDGLKYAIEREDPDQQMVNLSVAAIRAAGNSMEFQSIYDDKQHIQKMAEEAIAAQLASFGMEIVELVIEDPELPQSLADSLNGIREAEYARQAAVNLAEATFVRMVGEARAETESLRLKGTGVANFRLLVAEGNAAAIAVMQGKLDVEWTEETIGEGAEARTIKKPKFVDPVTKEEKPIEALELDPKSILDFFKVIDSNDAIRDAASKPGTVIVAPAGGSQDLSSIVAMLQGLNNQPALRRAA
jgi:regulator of protease activity HflC (stomatin/prohibitin superfamily)